jgi:hypothetical protein
MSAIGTTPQEFLPSRLRRSPPSRHLATLRLLRGDLLQSCGAKQLLAAIRTLLNLHAPSHVWFAAAFAGDVPLYPADAMRSAGRTGFDDKAGHSARLLDISK